MKTRNAGLTKWVLAIMVLVGASLLGTACMGGLKRDVITNRDLTAKENQEFRQLKGDDAQKTACLYPLFAQISQVGNNRYGNNLEMGKFMILCGLPVPFVDVGYYEFSDAIFNDKGGRILRIQGVGLAPLFTFAEADAKSEGGSWVHLISRARFFKYFGFGDYQGEKFFQFFLVLGKHRMDIEEATPSPLPDLD